MLTIVQIVNRSRASRLNSDFILCSNRLMLMPKANQTLFDNILGSLVYTYSSD
jgi:hypothetical protein